MFSKVRDDLVIQKSLHATQVTIAHLSVTVWVVPLEADICPGATEKEGCIRQNLSFSSDVEGRANKPSSEGAQISK